MAQRVSRRSLAKILLAPLIFFSWMCTKQRPGISKAAPFVKPKEKWIADDFYKFLNALPNDAMLALKKSLEIVDDKETQLKGGGQDARDIQKQALWLSSNILTYPFRDETKIDYHNLAMWVCGETSISKEVIQTASTFALERELHKMLFIQMWDKLNPQQRKDLLAKIDPYETITDKAAIATLSGAGALAALSATVALMGFSFYTTMSVTIAAVAATLGVTLPFATYVGTSTVVGILSGPVGWAIMGAATLGGLALAGRPNLKKTTALIAQIHALKAEALIAAGASELDVFNTR